MVPPVLAPSPCSYSFRVGLISAGMSQNVNPCAGTPLYMAPELFKGQRFTNKVDVFAYGVIVWEIYAREKPWVGYDPLDVRTEVGEIANVVGAFIHRC